MCHFNSSCFKWVVQPPARKINKTTWSGCFQDYIRVLSHAAARGAMANYALHERLRQLQGFLARNNRSVLDQETHAALAKLGLCCWKSMLGGRSFREILFFASPKNNQQKCPSSKQNALLREKEDRSLHILNYSRWRYRWWDKFIWISSDKSYINFFKMFCVHAFSLQTSYPNRFPQKNPHESHLHLKGIKSTRWDEDDPKTAPSLLNIMTRLPRRLMLQNLFYQHLQRGVN